MKTLLDWIEENPNADMTKLCLVYCKNDRGACEIIPAYWHFGRWHYSSGFPCKQNVICWSELNEYPK